MSILRWDQQGSCDQPFPEAADGLMTLSLLFNTLRFHVDPEVGRKR